MEEFIQYKQILTLLSKENIRYCVLRNFSFLEEERNPATSVERSVDLAVHSVDYARFHQIVTQSGFLRRKDQFSLKHKAYFKVIGKEMVSFDVQVGGVYWNDMGYLGDDIFERRVHHTYFSVLSVEDSVVMYILHSILGKRYFKQKYREVLVSLLLQVNSEVVISQLSLVFNRSIAEWLYRKVSERKFTYILRWKYFLILRFILCSPRHVVTSFFLFGRWIRWKKCCTAYPLISVIGPDGAGKSTLIKSLEEQLKRYNRKVRVIYTGRGRSQLLPIRTIGNRYKHKEKQSDKTRKDSILRKEWLYTLWAFVSTVDLLSRYFFKIMVARRRRTIVLTDRYCSDIFLMRYVPLFLKKLLLRLFPKPTLTFYLYNTVGVLHSRRLGETVEELERQMDLFRYLQQYLNAYAIQTDDLGATEQEVILKVMEFVYREWY